MRKALEELKAGLPAAWYRDPDHYRRELDVFWYGGWIAAYLLADRDVRDFIRIGTVFIAKGEHRSGVLEWIDHHPFALRLDLHARPSEPSDLHQSSDLFVVDFKPAVPAPRRALGVM